MIRSVSFEQTTYADPPARFEAGTPPIAEAIGLGAAVEYLARIGMERIALREQELLVYAREVLARQPRLRLHGSPRRAGGVLSFNLEGLHPHDVGTVLDHEGIAVRAGHHCAQPLMRRLGVPATIRASLACYTLRAELDALAAALHRAIEVLG
jgi:cysteine desulfurase/selenocysteine lyase